MPSLRGQAPGSPTAGEYYTGNRTSSYPTYHPPSTRIPGQSRYASPEAEASARPYADVGKVNLNLFDIGDVEKTAYEQQNRAAAGMPQQPGLEATLRAGGIDFPGMNLFGGGIDLLANLTRERGGSTARGFVDRLKDTPDDLLTPVERQMKSLNQNLFTEQVDSPIMQGKQINEMWKAYQIAEAHARGESNVLNPEPPGEMNPFGSLGVALGGLQTLTNMIRRTIGGGPLSGAPDLPTVPTPLGDFTPSPKAIPILGADQLEALRVGTPESLGEERQAIKEAWQAGDLNDNEARDMIALSSMFLTNPNPVDFPEGAPLPPHTDTAINMAVALAGEALGDPLTIPAIVATGGSYLAKTPMRTTILSIQRTVAKSLLEADAKAAGMTVERYVESVGSDKFRDMLVTVGKEASSLAQGTVGRSAQLRWLPKKATIAAKQTGRVPGEALKDMDVLDAFLDMGADPAHAWSAAIKTGIKAAGVSAEIAVKAPRVIKLGQAIDKLIDPFSMFGYHRTGRVVPIIGSRLAAHGFTDAIGWRVTRRLDSAYDEAGVNPDVVQSARGVAGGNHTIQAGDNANTQRMVAFNSVLRGPETPTEAAARNAERRPGDIRRLVKDQVDKTLEFILPATKGGAAEMLRWWRDRAARQLEAMGADPDAARGVAAKMEEREMRGLANDFWGFVIEQWDKAKRAGASQPTATWDAAGIERMTFMGPRQMSAQDADVIIKHLDADDVGAVRAAVRKYRDLNQFISESLPDAELMAQVRHVLLQIKDTLPTAIEDLSDLPQPIRDFLRDFPDQKLFLRPDDNNLLVGVRNAEGRMIGVKSWIDFVTTRTAPLEITRAKAWREGLLRGISGGELERNVTRRFAFNMAEMAGLSEAESASLKREINFAAESMGGGPRALNTEALNQAIDRASMTVGHKVLARRVVQDALFDAYENEMRLVGAVPKVTGWVKKQAAPIAGNTLSWVTDYLYPVVRFSRNALFFAQELPEAPFLLALAGRYPMSGMVPGRLAGAMEASRVPGVKQAGRKISESKASRALWDEKTMTVMDRMTRTSPNAEYDMYEAAELTRMGLTVGSQMTDQRTRLGKLLKNWQTLPERKRRSVALALRRDLGEQWKRSLQKNAPEHWLAVRAFYPDSMSDDEVAVQWMLDMMTRADPDSIYTRLSPNLYQPTHIGRRAEVSDQLVRHFAYGEAEAQNHTWADLVQEIKDGTMSVDQVRDSLTAAGADPDYVERAVRKLTFGTPDEFYQSANDLGVSKEATDSWRAAHEKKASLMGIELDEYLARKYIGRPLSVDQMGNFVGDTLYDDIVVSMRSRGKDIPASDSVEVAELKRVANDMITEVLRPEPVRLTRAEAAGRVSVPKEDSEIMAWAQTPGNETTKLRLLWTQTEQLFAGMTQRKKGDPLRKVAERRYKVIEEAIKEIESRDSAWPRMPDDVDEDGVLHLDDDGEWGSEYGPGEVPPSALGSSMLRGIPNGEQGIAEEGVPAIDPQYALDDEMPTERAFVYRDETGKPVAAVYVFFSVNGKPRDLSTYVAPSHRRQGIATELYDHIQQNTDINLEPISGVSTTPKGDAFTRSYWDAPSPTGETRVVPIPPQLPKGSSEDARKAASKVRGWERIRRERTADPTLHRPPTREAALPPMKGDPVPGYSIRYEADPYGGYYDTPAKNVGRASETGINDVRAVQVEDPGTGEVIGFVLARFDSDANTLTTIQSQVLDPHGRKGIANWMYRHLEQQTGATFQQASDQSPSARAFWAQRDRPFGPQQRSVREFESGLETGTVKPVRGGGALVEAESLNAGPDIPEEYWPVDVDTFNDPELKKMKVVDVTPDGRIVGRANRARVQAARQQGVKVQTRRVDWTEQPVAMRQEMPAEPGTVAVPDGIVRAYHYTSSDPEVLDSILSGGLQRSEARGETYGEPDQIWFSTSKPDSDRNYVEVHLRPDQITGSGSPPRHVLLDPDLLREWIDHKHKTGANFASFLDEIPAEQIVAHNRPWHHTYKRLAEEGPQNAEDFRKEFGFGLDSKWDRTPTGDAIRNRLLDLDAERPASPAQFGYDAAGNRTLPEGFKPEEGYVYRTVGRNRWMSDWDPGTYVSHAPGARYAATEDAVMLRVRDNVTGWDQAVGGVDPDANRISRGTVWAEDIEVYGADGKWHPVVAPPDDLPLYQSGAHTIGVTTPRQYKRQIETMMDPVAMKRLGLGRAMTEKEVLIAIEWYDHIRRATFALVDDALTGDARIMAAARILISFGTTQLNTSPADGFRHIFKAYGMKARGEELQLGEARNILQQAVGLNPEQLHALVWNDAEKISQMGIAQKLFDFIDSLTGSKTRTNGILGPRGDWGPVAVDVHTKRDFGYLDDSMGDWVYRLVSVKKGDEIVHGVKSKYIEGKGFVVEMSDGTTEIIPQKYIGKGVPTDGEYDFGVELGNDIRDYFNETGFMGREWSSYEVQALGWYRMQVLKSNEGDMGEVANAIYEQSRWMGSNDIFPGQGAPLNEQYPWNDITDDHLRTIVTEGAHHASDEAEMASGARVLTKADYRAVHDGAHRDATTVEVLSDVTGAEQYAAQYGLHAEQDVVVLMRDIIGDPRPPKYHGAGSGRGVGVSVDIPVRNQAHGEDVLQRLAATEGGALRAIGPRSYIAVATDGSLHVRTLWEPRGPKSDRNAFNAARDASGLAEQLGDDTFVERSVEYVRVENDWKANPDGKGYTDIIERGSHRHPVIRTPEQRVALVEQFDARYAAAQEATAKARRMRANNPKRAAAIKAAEKAEEIAKKERQVARATPAGRPLSVVQELVGKSRLRVREGVAANFDKYAAREVRHERERVLGEARDAAGDSLGTDPTVDAVLDLARASNGERLYDRAPNGTVRAAVTRESSGDRRSQLYFNRTAVTDKSLVHEIIHDDIAWEMDDSANRIIAGIFNGLEGTPYGTWVPGTPLTEPQHEWLVNQFFLWSEQPDAVHPVLAPILKHMAGKLGAARTLKTEATGPAREAIKRIDNQIAILNVKRATLKQGGVAQRRVDAQIAALKSQRAAATAEAATLRAAGGLSPDVAKVLDDIAASAGARSESRASTFNADEQDMMEWAQIAMAASQRRANDLVHMRGERSALERSINHPFLMMYPTSYMYGKVLPYLTEFLMARPFGMKAPFLAYSMGNSMHQSFQRQQQYDEELRLYLYKNEPFLRAMSLFVPGLPWDLPSAFPFWMRRIIENWLTNNVRAMNGEKPEDLDVPGMIADSALYQATLRGTESWAPIIQGAQQAPDIFGAMVTGRVPTPEVPEPTGPIQ